MKTKTYLVMAGAMLITLNSCIEGFMFLKGNGIEETEIRRTAGFINVENTTSADVIYKKADTTGVTITGDENLIEYIVTETYDNTLEIKFRNDGIHLDFKKRPVITITSPKLEKVILSGSGAFFADEMTGNTVTLKLSGSGDISVENVISGSLIANISGSGNISIPESQNISSDLFISGSGEINISGNSTSGNIKITGSGEVYTEGYNLKTASVLISGSGNSYIKIEVELNAIISGSGSIYLKGNPLISKTISGSGRIINY